MDARHRPFGLYAIIALLLLNAILIVLDVTRSYIGLTTELGLPPPRLPGLDDDDVNRAARYLSAGGYAAAALGLWTLRRWAWVALMIVVGLALAEGLFRYARADPRYATMALNVLIVFYLNQRDVQRLFQRDRDRPLAV